jgi:hypothetical protein
MNNIICIAKSTIADVVGRWFYEGPSYFGKIFCGKRFQPQKFERNKLVNSDFLPSTVPICIPIMVTERQRSAGAAITVPCVVIIAVIVPMIVPIVVISSVVVVGRIGVVVIGRIGVLVIPIIPIV